MRDEEKQTAEIDYRDTTMDQAVEIVRTYERARDGIDTARKEVEAAKKVLEQKQAALDLNISQMKSARNRLDKVLASPAPTV